MAKIPLDLSARPKEVKACRAAHGVRMTRSPALGGEPNVYQVTLEIQKLEEGPYLGTSPELPGLIVQGASPEEVVELAPDIARELIEVMLETGEALPAGLRPLATPTRVPLLVPA